MLVNIKEQGTKKGVEIDGRFYSFQGANQDRTYINLNGRTISLNSKIRDFAHGSTVELDDYKSTRQNKSTTEHTTRKAKTPYSIGDYLDDAQKQELAKLQTQKEELAKKLQSIDAKFRSLVELSSQNYKKQQEELKAQKLAQQKAKQDAQKAKKLAQLKKLAQELGVSIA